MTRGPVWIDLANSPHVLFFQPVIAELHRRGIHTVVSARDFAQTVELCGSWASSAEVVGGHGGSRPGGQGGQPGRPRARAAQVRQVQLARRWPSATTPTPRPSRGGLSGIPVVTAMDYEFQPANHLAFRCASLVVVPDVFPLDVLDAPGCQARQGLALPRAQGGDRAGRFRARPRVSAACRRPGQGAADDTRGGDRRPTPGRHGPLPPLREPAVRRVAREAGAAPPRRTELPWSCSPARRHRPRRWRARASADFSGKATPSTADSSSPRPTRSSARAGSMNREAAVLGTPAYSIYAGKLAAVDRALVAEGKLTLLRSSADVAALEFAKKPTARGATHRRCAPSAVRRQALGGRGAVGVPAPPAFHGPPQSNQSRTFTRRSRLHSECNQAPRRDQKRRPRSTPPVVR